MEKDGFKKEVYEVRRANMVERFAPERLILVCKWARHEAVESERHIQWTRELSAMTPFATGGVYVNFLGDEGAGRVRAAYGPEKYRRLSELKKKYDPENFFRLNQNIKPAD